MRRDDRQDDHHIRPKSRNGGRKHNIVRLPRGFHEHWHALFVNMTLEEVHEFIVAIMQPGSAWTYKDIDMLRVGLMRKLR